MVRQVADATGGSYGIPGCRDDYLVSRLHFRRTIMDWQPISTAPRQEDYKEILVWNGDWVCSVVLFEGNWIDHFCDIVEGVTHWQPLPDPPMNQGGE